MHIHARNNGTRAYVFMRAAYTSGTLVPIHPRTGLPLSILTGDGGSLSHGAFCPFLYTRPTLTTSSERTRDSRKTPARRAPLRYFPSILLVLENQDSSPPLSPALFFLIVSTLSTATALKSRIDYESGDRDAWQSMQTRGRCISPAGAHTPRVYRGTK